MDLIIKGKAGRIFGEIRVPGDKSISHRSIILGALAEGDTVVKNLLVSDDVLRTIQAFKDMGVNIEFVADEIIIHGVGLYGLKKPERHVECGNSGTTARLMSGILAGQKFPSTLVGDQSLSRRPMDRVIIPLRKMGAEIYGRDDKYLPLEIKPAKSKLKAISYELPVASAQVKSAILLASLYANGTTEIIENKKTRDHTERMLKLFGCKIRRKGNSIIMDSNSLLKGKNIYVPGDISSAAYFIVAAAMVEGSDLLIKDVGINPTRDGIIHVLKKMGADIAIINERIVNNEPVGDIRIRYAPLTGISIDREITGIIIDEIPILAVAASVAKGRTIIRDVKELKYKESNRIYAISKELSKMGAKIEALEDGMIIEGVDRLKGAVVDSHGDHRIAMALSIAALVAEGSTIIGNHECVSISYPNFFDTLELIYRDV